MMIFWEINKIPSARLIAFIGNLIAGAIPESERSPGEGNDNPSSILAWRIPGQRSLEGYSPRGRRVRHA